MLKKIMGYYFYSLLFIVYFFIVQKYGISEKYFLITIPVLILLGYKYSSKQTNAENGSPIPARFININYVLTIIISAVLLLHLNNLVMSFFFYLFVFVNVIQIALCYIHKEKLVKFYTWADSLIYEQNNSSDKENNKTKAISFFAGFIFVFLGLIYLEIFNQHYFFLQDDNFHQFLPTIIQSCRDLFENGLFPEINPYQAGGLPTSSCGIYSLTYPLPSFNSYSIVLFLS